METKKKAIINLSMNEDGTLNVEISGSGFDISMLLITAFIESPLLLNIAEHAIKTIPGFLKYKEEQENKNKNQTL